MNPSDLLVSTLATYRLSLLLSQEDGPSEVFSRLRSSPVLWDRYPTLAEGLRCFWCVSVWAGAITPLLPRYLRYALAASGGAVALIQVLDFFEGDEGGFDHPAEVLADDIKRMALHLVNDDLLDERGAVVLNQRIESVLRRLHEITR